MKEERYRETEPLKKGELVVMHTCVEARNPKYEGKIWTCKTDQFTQGEGAYAQDLIFLEGFTGSFASEFLQRVNVEPLLAEKDATIKELQDEVKKQSDLKRETYRENAKWQDECNKLRKALEEAKAEYSKEGTDIQVLRRMIKIIDAALGEGDKE